MLILDINFDALRNEVSIVNEGLGLAILTKIKFFRDGKTHYVESIERNKSLFELFEFPHGCTWRECKVFREREYYLRPGQRFECVVLGYSELEEMLGGDKARQVFDLYPAELSRMRVEITYCGIARDRRKSLVFDFAEFRLWGQSA
jgi:hypothetical protein